MLAPRYRRRRAAYAKVATLVTLFILLFTPRMDLSGQALSSPSPAEAGITTQQN